MTARQQQTPGQDPKAANSFYFQWHLLEQCNLRCRHCYQTAYQDRGVDGDGQLRIARMMEAALAQWRYSGRVSLTGGEPLLIPEQLFALLDFFAASPHFEWVGILTNGTKLDGELARRFSQYEKLREVQVSLDGPGPKIHDGVRGKGSFSAAVRGIEHLQQFGAKTSVMFTLTRQNIGAALDMIDLALDLGVNALTIERATPLGPRCETGDLIETDHLRDTYTAIAHRKKELRPASKLQIRTSRPLWCLVDPEMGGFCPAGLSCLAILHDGTALPCRRLEIPLGNILRDGLYRIWYTSEVLWKLRNKKLLAAGCKDCGFLGNCGGCRAIAHAVTGDFMGADLQCWKNDWKNNGSPLSV